MDDLIKRLEGPSALTCLKEDALLAADRLRKLEADERRMDYLESEAIREIDLTGPRSLFRRNMPITREAIDEALAACGDES